MIKARENSSEFLRKLFRVFGVKNVPQNCLEFLPNEKVSPILVGVFAPPIWVVENSNARKMSPKTLQSFPKTLV